MASVLQHERVGDIGDAVTDGVTTAQSVMGGQGRSDEKDEPLVVEDFVDNLPLDLECDYDGNHSQCEGLDAKIPAQDSASNEGATGVGKKMDEDETHHDNHENKKLAKMGLNTALAIGLHNFPEGTLSRAEIDDIVFFVVLSCHLVRLKSNIICSQYVRTCNFCCGPRGS